MNQTITLPRAAVEQAIAALKSDEEMATAFYLEISALRSSLEQPQNHIPDAGNMVTAGWKLVPVEPTDDMEAAAETDYEQFNGGYFPDWLSAYRAMLAAAPQPPAVEQPQIDWQDMYLKEKRRAEMWIAKYEQDIGKLERAAPVAEQPQSEQGPASVAKVIGMDEFGPMLLWHRAWTDFPVGIKLYTSPQPKREPLTVEAKAVIDAARAAMDESTQSYNDRGDISIASELADALSLRLDEYDRAIEAAHGIGGEA